MPSIPSISEQYKKAQGFVQQQGLAVSEEQFGARVTNEKEALTKERDMGLEAYEELKKELLEDTAFIGFLVLFLGCIWLPDKQVLSYFVGMIGSIGYSFLLTRTADSIGEQGNSNPSFASGTPARFLILFVLILLYANNRATLDILPIMAGFFIPYKLASLRPAFVSAPPLLADEIRISRPFGASEPTKVEYGSAIRNVPRYSSSMGMGESGKEDDVKVGSGAPIGKRRIKSIQEQYEELRRGTM